MSFVDRRLETRPKIGEAPFKLSEVFFSRTDVRGIIKTGNYVFQRVSGYGWDKLLGAPHKVIRHPEMPKAVFWLFWDMIKRGEIVGAYVNNQAADGLNYWVYATIMPVEDGFISVRIKPTSPLFETIQKEYAALYKAEQEQGLSAEESAKMLLERITALGYEDYTQFFIHALSEELVARDEGLGSPVDNGILRSKTILKHAEDLQAETQKLIESFSSMRIIPHNMRVIASRLEPSGGPFSTLSQNYGTMSQEISEWFEEHVNGEASNFTTIRLRINSSMFLNCTARIMKEAAKQLDKERRKLGSVDLEEERVILRSLDAEYSQKSVSELAQVNHEAEKILEACVTMHRQIVGLSTTRVMCKIESARVGKMAASLDGIINQLDSFQTSITDRLDRIAFLCKAIRSA